MVDPAQVRQWRQADDRMAMLLELAAAIPEILATVAEESHRLTQGVDKRALAGVLSGSWFLASSAVLDLLRERCTTVPYLQQKPEAIKRLEKIARG